MTALFAAGLEVSDAELRPVPLFDALTTLQADDDQPAALTLPALHPSFWQTYPEFERVRDFAHHRGGSPDALLAAVYARVSALVRRGTVVASGMLSPVRLNMFVSLVGASGRGKSACIGLARELLPYTGERWQVAEAGGEEDFAERGLGSGEGIVETYMGGVPDHDNVGPKGGRPRVIRRQVRHNALQTADEGGYFTTAMARQGSSLGPLLREAWNSSRMGQQNGSTDTSRNVTEHCLGIIIGFQPTPAATLFGELEIELGLPQRFLWVPARSPWPEVRPDDPGPFDDWEPPGFGTVLRPPAHICRELYEEWRSDEERAPLDSQRPAMLLKLAALTAILCGRTAITETDWWVALNLYELNRRVQAALLAHVADREERAADRLREERATTAAVTRDRVDRVGRDKGRVVLLLMRHANKIEAEHDRSATRSELRKALPARDRPLFESAMGSALAGGDLIEVVGENGYRVGEPTPASPGEPF